MKEFLFNRLIQLFLWISVLFLAAVSIFILLPIIYYYNFSIIYVLSFLVVAYVLYTVVKSPFMFNRGLTLEGDTLYLLGFNGSKKLFVSEKDLEVSDSYGSYNGFMFRDGFILYSKHSSIKVSPLFISGFEELKSKYYTNTYLENTYAEGSRFTKIGRNCAIFSYFFVAILFVQGYIRIVWEMIVENQFDYFWIITTLFFIVVFVPLGLYMYFTKKSLKRKRHLSKTL